MLKKALVLSHFADPIGGVTRILYSMCNSWYGLWNSYILMNFRAVTNFSRGRSLFFSATWLKSGVSPLFFDKYKWTKNAYNNNLPNLLCNRNGFIKRTFFNFTNINLKISDKHGNYPTNFFRGAMAPWLPGHATTAPTASRLYELPIL